MEEKTACKKSFLRRAWWVIPLAIVLILAIVFFAYVSVYYRADEVALAAMKSSESVRVSETAYGYLFDGPSEDEALIFYPGGKVQETAYAPLLVRLAASGIDVCLVKMPFRLAVFDASAAEDVMKAHSYGKNYLGGHSLGGAMAANCASTHGEEIDGLILLAAYPTKALPEGMTVLSIYGTQDGVLNRQKLEEGRKYLPASARELAIEGGNHAQFGSYGVQKGDGVPSVTAAAQQEETVRFVLSVLKGR